MWVSAQPCLVALCAATVFGLSLATYSLGDNAHQKSDHEQVESQFYDRDHSRKSRSELTVASPSKDYAPTDQQTGDHNDEPEKPSTDTTAEKFQFLGDSPAQWIVAATSVFATCLSGWAVWLLKRTLDATRDAVEVGQGANKIADEGVRIARETAEAQTRAYVGIVNINVRNYILGGKAEVSIEIKNFGNTPGRKVRIASAIVFLNDKDQRKIPKSLDSPHSTITLGGSQSFILSYTFDDYVSIKEINDLKACRRFLVVAGVIFYTDIFKKTRRTTFRHFLDASKIGSEPIDFPVCSRNNKST